MAIMFQNVHTKSWSYTHTELAYISVFRLPKWAAEVAHVVPRCRHLSVKKNL